VARFSVVVCGGGVAGLEAILRLRRLAGDRLDITLLSPSDTFRYRPWTVLEPFNQVAVRHYPISRLVQDAGCRWIRGELGWVNRAAHVAYTRAGDEVSYDAVVVALGGRELPPPPAVLSFAERTAKDYQTVVENAVAERLDGIGYIAPASPCWPLPLYELALMTAARLAVAGSACTLTFDEPADRPLAVFGPAVGDAIVPLLHDAGIRLRTGPAAMKHSERLTAQSHPRRILVTVPRIAAESIPGLPSHPVDGFLPIDEHSRLIGGDGTVFAAGDVTQSPVKHGALAAQQADNAAAMIAFLAGAAPYPGTHHPMLRATLLTGERPIYLKAQLAGNQVVRCSATTRTPRWSVTGKIAARELSPYLARVPARNVIATGAS
jgi:sulfide:quinone oxidoreductase